ncbi:MAG: hypothetical protein HYY04_04605 [Chloroflexi bacterium]|nr:hypothetical protein [Chloroflexota bacterium]
MARPLVKPLGDLFDREHLHPGRREFNCQWHPSQSPADLGDGRSVLVGHGEARRDGSRPVDEESDRLVLGELMARWQALQFRRRQGGYLPGHFSGDAKRLSAGRQQVQIRTRAQQSIGELR